MCVFVRSHCDLIAFNNITNDYENVQPKKGFSHINCDLYATYVCSIRLPHSAIVLVHKALSLQLHIGKHRRTEYGETKMYDFDGYYLNNIIPFRKVYDAVTQMHAHAHVHVQHI